MWCIHHPTEGRRNACMGEDVARPLLYCGYFCGQMLCHPNSRDLAHGWRYFRCVAKEGRNTSLGADNSKNNTTFVEIILLENVAYLPFGRKEKEYIHGQRV